jgi:1-phosphofructokinase family hexose kinase
VVLVAGLTPAWQQVLLFDTFAPGAVNRAREAHWCASGKVLNAARALHHLGAPCRALTVVGGVTGGEIRRDFARLGIAARWVEGVTPTRVCTTILDAARHSATELVPNAGEVTDAECAAFLAAYAEEAAGAAVVVLIGSLPTGMPATWYRDLLARAPGRAILDVRGPELLEALPRKPFLVKPNREELQRTLGRELRGDAELFGAMSELNERGAEWVVITDGHNPTHASSGGRFYRLQPLRRDLVNPIGCGDCMAAAIAWALCQGKESLEAVRYGMATAADKVGRLLPGAVDRDTVEGLVGSVAVTEL